MKEKEKILKEFIEFKKTSVSDSKRIKNIEYFLKQFLESSKKPLSKFQEQDIINFLNAKSKKYSVGTINHIKVLLKLFITWKFFDYPMRFRNLNKILQTNKTKPTYSAEEMLTKEDIEKLVQAEKETYWKCYWLLYFYGGFRPKEVCELKWEQIVYEGDTAFINHYATKTKKMFQKFIPENVVFYLKKLQNNNSVYVFPTKRKHINTSKRDKPRISVGDKPLTRSGVYQHLRDIAPIVLGKRINPYILRHSIATILYNRDDLKDEDVAQQLGHKRDMKEQYSHLSVDRLRERLKKLYIAPEDLPPEKKAEFEKKLEELKKKISIQEEKHREEERKHAELLAELYRKVTGKKIEIVENSLIINPKGKKSY